MFFLFVQIFRARAAPHNRSVTWRR